MDDCEVVHKYEHDGKRFAKKSIDSSLEMGYK